MQPIPQVPILDGNPWHITHYPNLGDLQYGPEHEIVDHAIWQAKDGSWHCLACIRGTKVGRVLYEWEGGSIEQPDWKPLGITMRADRSYGESINDWLGEEWIQAPHVIEHNGTYYMFYGGHNTELGESQICLATSPDGRAFTRHKNERGFSRLFVGPGGARDPMVLNIGGLWHCYYCANDTGKRRPNKDYVRTSADLIHWSDYREVAWGGFVAGAGNWNAECPFVIYRNGYYYLFRTSEYSPPARTHVYRSQDPYDFGLGNDGKWVQTLRVAAPEVIQVGDQLYISSVEDLKGGIQVFRLKWI
jgi:hypothetical protein